MVAAVAVVVAMLVVGEGSAMAKLEEAAIAAVEVAVNGQGKWRL